LYQQLRKLRDNICSKNNQPIYIVAGSATLNEMARYLPQSAEELIKIRGFGKVKVDAYGERFLKVINDYCQQHILTSRIHEKLPKRQRKEKSAPKPDTKSETFKLYKEGKTVEEIASIRNFTEQTIEGHLAHFVSTGEIKIDELVSREKPVLIEPAINNFEGGNITYVKKKLGNDISFGEIKLAIAWKEYQKTNPATFE
jgi:ATP-dependent DNA helicase RecQ